MMNFITVADRILVILFFLCYAYQFFYIPVAWLAGRRRRPTRDEGVPHRLAILVAARNEETVIGHLLDSLRAQDYPAELWDVYVVADNCTDRTAEVSRAHGAIVRERHDLTQVGKGYALNYLLARIPVEAYDAFLVFDADNLLAPTYLTEMNRTFSDGYEIVTSYRNSKNYGDNWISAGYALWFLREARYLNGARMALGSSCAVSGTGFLFSRRVLEACGGWHFFLLTEDIEFTVDRVCAGERIGYCAAAEFYDEQPTRLSQSIRQRMRWARGYWQVFRHYGGRLLKGIFCGTGPRETGAQDGGRRKGRFACYDMTMNILPMAILSVLGLVINTAGVICRFATDGEVTTLVLGVCRLVGGLFLTVFVLGAITTLTEWRRIHCPGWKKILYTFTFPLFMATYLPIAVASLFVRVRWKPIRHERGMTLRQATQGKGRKEIP